MSGSKTWSHKGFSACVFRQGSGVSVPHWPTATTSRSLCAEARERRTKGPPAARSAAAPACLRKTRRPAHPLIDMPSGIGSENCARILPHGRTLSMRAALAERVAGPSPIEPGGDEPPAVVVADVRPVVLDRRIPDADIGARRRLDVVLLLGEVPLDLVDDLAPRLRIAGAALADQHVVEHGIVHVAAIARLAGV